MGPARALCRRVDYRAGQRHLPAHCGRCRFQLDFQFTVVHRLPMTFSIGFASAYENGDKLDDEWLFSLKIL